MRRALVLVFLATILLVPAACGDDDDGDGEPSETTAVTTTDGAVPSTTATSTPTPGSPTTAGGPGPLDDATAEPKQGTAEGDATALLVDVRVGAHEGFDRVVFEFRDDDVPGYEVAYVEPPITEDGSGEEVDVAGDAFLSVRMEPASGVDLSGESFEETYTGPERLDGAGSLAEVVRTGDFEAVLNWVIGTDGEQPFTVRVFDDPVRLVVDVTS